MPYIHITSHIISFEGVEVDGTGLWIGSGISSQGGRMVGDAAIG